MLNKLIKKLIWAFSGKCTKCGGHITVSYTSEDNIYFGPIIKTIYKCDDCGKQKTVEDGQDSFTFP